MISAQPEAINLVIPAGIVLVIALFLLVLRFLQHRERIAMIQRGLIPPGTMPRPKSDLRSGVVTAGAGVGLTAGLATMGLGPWLIVGLIPLCVGIGLIVLHLLTAAANTDRPDPSWIGMSAEWDVDERVDD